MDRAQGNQIFERNAYVRRSADSSSGARRS